MNNANINFTLADVLDTLFYKQVTFITFEPIAYDLLLDISLMACNQDRMFNILSISCKI